MTELPRRLTVSRRGHASPFARGEGDLRRQERRRRSSREPGLAGGDDELHDVAALRPEGRASGEDPLGEATPTSALGPETALPPDDAVTESLLRRIIRGFHALDSDEGPEGLLVLEELTACSRDLEVGTPHIPHIAK